MQCGYRARLLRRLLRSRPKDSRLWYLRYSEHYKIYRVLESAIYLAAGSYTGTDGCTNFQITGNNVFEPYNNILVIGGKHNTVQGNNVVRSANAGIMQWHSLATSCGSDLGKI